MHFCMDEVVAVMMAVPFLGAAVTLIRGILRT